MNPKERNDLIISWLTISAAFGIVLGKGFLNIISFMIAFPIMLLTVGLGFICHEMAHRFVAIHFGAHAEYRAWTAGLVMAIGLAIVTFGKMVFAAPGAVYIYGPHINRRENGLISLAGPVANIAIAIAFLGLGFVSNLSLIQIISSIGIQVNVLLAMFNLLPIPPLDGSKVFAWNPIVWVIAFVPLAILFFLI